MPTVFLQRRISIEMPEDERACIPAGAPKYHHHQACLACDRHENRTHPCQLMLLVEGNSLSFQETAFKLQPMLWTSYLFLYLWQQPLVPPQALGQTTGPACLATQSQPGDSWNPTEAWRIVCKGGSLFLSNSFGCNSFELPANKLNKINTKICPWVFGWKLAPVFVHSTVVPSLPKPACPKAKDLNSTALFEPFVRERLQHPHESKALFCNDAEMQRHPES